MASDAHTQHSELRDLCHDVIEGKSFLATGPRWFTVDQQLELARLFEQYEDQGRELAAHRTALAAKFADWRNRVAAVSEENERLQEQLQTAQKSGGWAAAEKAARQADGYEAVLKEIAEDTEPNHYSRLQAKAREALYPAKRPS